MKQFTPLGKVISTADRRVADWERADRVGVDEEAMSEVFQQRLREARVRNGWTQKQVEEWSDLPAGTLAQFEAGIREPGFDNLVKLCDGLRVSSDWLVGLID